jgi:hypothetical protein
VIAVEEEEEEEEETFPLPGFMKALSTVLKMKFGTYRYYLTILISFYAQQRTEMPC